MKNRARKKSLLVVLALITAGLLLAGCGETTEDKTTEEGSELTTFTFDISSFSPQAASGNAVGDVTPANLVEATGSLLIVGPKGERYLFAFNPIFDEATLTITTTLEIKLEPGLYTFYFLLNLTIQGVTHQYAAIAPVLIFEAVENKVHLNLNPTLTLLASVDDLQALSRVTFDYPADIFTWANPRFGFSIDGGVELFFTINKDSAKGPVVILLAARSQPYNTKCRFYDGSLVRVVCPGSEEVIVLPPPGEAPLEIEPVPLTAETTYSFTAEIGGTTGEATFLFNIPKEILDEVGGQDNSNEPLSGRLLATATLVGPENTLTEQILALTPQINTETNAISFYQASITVSGFDPGTLTWAVNFFDIRNNGSQQFAYCALTVDVTSGEDPNHGSFVCDLQFINRSLAGQYPVGTVNVLVSDGSLVLDAVILVDNEPVGITGSGTTGNPVGTFSFFLSTGSHQITARHEIVDPLGSGELLSRTATVQTINLIANSVQMVALSLAPLPEPPVVTVPTVTSILPDGGDVEIDTKVTVVFSTAMDKASSLAFRIAPEVAGTIEWNSDKAFTFTPLVPLAYQTAYTVTIEAAKAIDTSGTSMGESFSVTFTTVKAPVADPLILEAAMTRRPKRRYDGFITLDVPTRVRIPTQLQVEIVNDENGNPLGNPERFLLFLRLGKVKCIYLGGKWERYLGWVREHRDERAFKSPACNKRKYAGDIITVGHWSDKLDGDPHLHGAKIKARVISSDPAFKETRIRVTIPVVTE